MIPRLHPESADEIHRLRHEKYAVQRLAARFGVFGRDAKPGIVALRLDPCDPAPDETRD